MSVIARRIPGFRKAACCVRVFPAAEQGIGAQIQGIGSHSLFTQLHGQLAGFVGIIGRFGRASGQLQAGDLVTKLHSLVLCLRPFQAGLQIGNRLRTKRTRQEHSEEGEDQGGVKSHNNN